MKNLLEILKSLGVSIVTHLTQSVMQTSLMILATDRDRNSLGAHQTIDKIVPSLRHFIHDYLGLAFKSIKLALVICV